MKGRDDILAAIRANKPKLDAPAPDVPNYDDALPGDAAGLETLFIEHLEKMGGRWVEPVADETLDAAWRRALADQLEADASIVSNVPAITGNRRISTGDAPASLDDVDVAILPAIFGVAETGSVCFTENELIVNSIAYLAQHLIVVLDPADILANMHRAYRRDEFRRARYTVFHTGPSATADIEGVLVRGAQGARSLTVIPDRGS